MIAHAPSFMYVGLGLVSNTKMSSATHSTFSSTLLRLKYEKKNRI